VEATSVGHDLKWGIATFEKPIRLQAGTGPSDDDRQAMEDATREWELTAAARGALRAVESGLPADPYEADGARDTDDEPGDEKEEGDAVPWPANSLAA
jgi:single-strand DNA-binding protein